MQEKWSRIPTLIKGVLSSHEWGDLSGQLAVQANLSKEQFVDLQLEIILVLLGLAHPDDFQSIVTEKLTTKSALAPSLATKIQEKIFIPIYPTLIKFFEDESLKETAPTSIGAAPANIPTGIKEEPLLPPLTPKVIQPKAPAPEVILMHPFEEKMQSAPVAAVAPTPSAMPATFTPAPVSPTPSAPVVPAAPQGAVAFTPAQNSSPRGTLTHDPYREPLE